MNPRESEFGIYSSKIMRITSLRKGSIHWLVTVQSTKFLHASSDENCGCEQSMTRKWEKLEKIPAWNLDKMKNKKDVWKHRKRQMSSPFCATLMAICDLKNAELEPKHHKYQGRVVLQGDIVKDDSGAYAVFTEQGSAASQMTAAKVMDVIARLPGCAGKAADAVSFHIQVKKKTFQCWKNAKVRVSRYWIRVPRHKRPKSWSDIEDLVVPLEQTLNGQPLACMLWERQFETVLLGLGWEKKVPNWEWFFCYRKQGLFLSAKIRREHYWSTQKCSSHVFCWSNWKLPGGRNLTPGRLRCPTTWKDRLKNALAKTANLQTKRRSNCTKFRVLAWMITRVPEQKKKTGQNKRHSGQIKNDKRDKKNNIGT